MGIWIQKLIFCLTDLIQCTKSKLTYDLNKKLHFLHPAIVSSKESFAEQQNIYKLLL